jgi:chromosome partitioning protein
VHLLPATIDLAGAELHLLSKTGREYQLRRGLQPLLGDYDVVLVDCPPSLGILTINGLTAADEVLVPLQCETLSHRGVGQLLETIDDVRSYTNPDLRVRGVIATMFDRRTRLAQQVVDDVPGRYGLSVLQPPVPKSVKVAEAPSHGCTILRHASSSKGAQAYREIAAQLVPQPA